MGPCLRVPGEPSFDDAAPLLEPMQQRCFPRADRDRDTRVVRGSPGFIDPDGAITKDEANGTEFLMIEARRVSWQSPAVIERWSVHALVARTYGFPVFLGELDDRARMAYHRTSANGSRETRARRG